MTNTVPPVTRYPDLPALLSALAVEVARILTAAIGSRGRASLVVSGGKSPIGFFESLRTQQLDWARVSITLADERWVAPSDADSNEKLVRDHLLKEAAAAAHFSGLKNAAATPELGAAEAWRSVARIARPFDVVILGMGDDGHTASLFPHSPNLSAAIDPAAAPACIGMVAPTQPAARMSLNLAALLDSRSIVLLLNGDAKWQVYEAATGPGPVADMPVRAVLRQHHTPVAVAWAP